MNQNIVLPITSVALLLLACGGPQNNLKIEKSSYDQIAKMSLSAEAASKLKEKTYAVPTVTSASIKVRSAIYDESGRGILIEEDILNKKADEKISSAFTISTKTHNGKTKSASGSLVFDELEEGLELAVNGSSYYVAASLPSLLCVSPNRGIELAAFIPTNESKYEDKSGYIQAGYADGGDIAIEYHYRPQSVPGSSTYDYYSYTLNGSEARCKKHVSYQESTIEKAGDKFHAQSMIVYEYGYTDEAIEKEVDVTLPQTNMPYCYAADENDFQFLPLMNVSDFFSDGLPCSIVSPYAPCKLSLSDIGFATTGTILGQSGEDCGFSAFFWPRLSSL